MNLKEIYNDKKKTLDYGYMEFFNSIAQDIDNDDEYTLSDDERDELIVDLMLSNVLGEITTFNEVSNLLKLAREDQGNTSDTIITNEII